MTTQISKHHGAGWPAYSKISNNNLFFFTFNQQIIPYPKKLILLYMYTYPIYIKLACMIRMITLILPLCCLFNPERHELARGIYIIREVYIAMFVIRIIQLTIAFHHSYHTCKLDIDWISILLKISKINASFDIIAACSSSPSLLLLPFASCS